MSVQPLEEALFILVEAVWVVLRMMVVEYLEALNHRDDVHAYAIIPLAEVNALNQRTEIVDGAEQRILIDLCHALMNSLPPLAFR